MSCAGVLEIHTAGTVEHCFQIENQSDALWDGGEENKNAESLACSQRSIKQNTCTLSRLNSLLCFRSSRSEHIVPHRRADAEARIRVLIVMKHVILFQVQPEL